MSVISGDRDECLGLRGGGCFCLEIVSVIIAVSFRQRGNLFPKRRGIESNVQVWTMGVHQTVPGLPSIHGDAQGLRWRSSRDAWVPHSHFVAATSNLLGAFNSLYRECNIYIISFTVICTSVLGDLGMSISISQLSKQLLLTRALRARDGSEDRVPSSAAPIPWGFCAMPDMKGPIGREHMAECWGPGVTSWWEMLEPASRN